MGQVVDRRLLVAVGCQLSVVLLGVTWGKFVGYPGRHQPTVYSVASVASALLMTVGMAKLYVQSDGRAVWAAGSLGYAGWLVLREPLLCAWDYGPLVVAAAQVCPLVLALGQLARPGSWVAAVGVGLFAATACAVLTSGLGCHWCTGFFSGWIA